MLLFENNKHRASHKRYFPPTVETNGYNVMIDGWNFFHKPIRSDIKTYEKVRKNAVGQRDDYTTGCLIDYSFLKEIILADWNRLQ